MALVLFAAPAEEPLTVAEVKAHLSIDIGNQMPAPTAPTVALGSGTGSVNNGVHRYLATFATASGETEAGTPSSAVTVVDNAVNGKVAISGIPIGGTGVIARKLYRTLAGGSVFYLLATLADNITTTYTDNVADGSLGVGAPSANTADDLLLNMLIASARAAAETITRRALVTQTWDLVLDCFPGWEIAIPKPTLQSVTSISYVDTNGVTQIVDPVTYLVDPDGEPARVTPAFGLIWPVTRWQMNAVRIRFVAGYGSATAVPQGIKNWMLMRIGTLWENRAEVFIDTRLTMVELPSDFVDGLLDPYRVDDFSWATP